VDLKLTEQDFLIEQTFAKFFGAESPPAKVRASEPLGFDSALWDRAVSMGAPTMGVPESLGGSDVAPTGLVVMAREVGRHLAPIPLVESIAAANLLARAGAGDLAKSVGEGVIATITTRAPVDGRCRLVPAAAVADVIVTIDGDDLVALRRRTPARQSSIASPPNLGCSPIADVQIDDSSFTRIKLASGAAAQKLFRDGVSEWTLLTAAALDGLRAAALDLAVKHVKERKAFGVTIGWFQGIQHRLADLFAAGEGARLLVFRAAWARKNELEEAANLATMAFLFLADLSFKTCREALQFHGGYGYTLDFDIQLYIRRARTWPLCIGNLRGEYQRLAARMYPE
jgi:alkylation response protein AidB-like acyl-CoA dehydrogenase